MGLKLAQVLRHYDWYRHLFHMRRHRWCSGNSVGGRTGVSRTAATDSSGIYHFTTHWQENRAVAGYDRTHNVQIWGGAMPFGKGELWAKTGVSSWILGGWSVDPLICGISGPSL